jgi:hypothetical protein
VVQCVENRQLRIIDCVPDVLEPVHVWMDVCSAASAVLRDRQAGSSFRRSSFRAEQCRERELRGLQKRKRQCSFDRGKEHWRLGCGETPPELQAAFSDA